MLCYLQHKLRKRVTKTMILSYLILLFVVAVKCKLEDLPDEASPRLSLTMCVMLGAEEFNVPNKTITVSLSMFEVSSNKKSATVISTILFPRMFAKMKWTFVIFNFTQDDNPKERRGIKPPSAYIIQIRRKNEIILEINKLKSRISWNPHAKFLIMSATVFKEPDLRAQEILQKLSDEMVVSGVVLLPNPKVKNEYNVYTFYPYSEKNCHGNVTIVKVDSCTYGNASWSSVWFEPKIPSTLNNCTYAVQYIYYPPYTINIKNNTYKTENKYFDNLGIDVNLLNTIAKYKNMTLKYVNSNVPQNWGDVTENGSVYGDLENLNNHDNIKFAIGGYALTYLRSTRFDISQSYISDGLVWCTPSVMVDTYLEKMLKILKWETWLAVILVYLTTTFLMWTFGKSIKSESTSYKSYSSSLLNGVSVLIGFSVKSLPRSNTIRYLMALLLLFSFNLDSAFQTYLTSILANNYDDYLYSNVNDIYKANLKMYVLPNSARYFKNYSTKLKELWRNCTELQTCLADVAANKTSVLCTPVLFKEYIENSVVSKNNRKLIHCFKQRVTSYPITILMKKGFPLLKNINEAILQLMQAGLVDKWERDILLTKAKEPALENLEDDDMEYVNTTTRQLRLRNIKPAFQILFLGFILSVISFLIEIVIYKFKAKHMPSKDFKNI